MKEEEQSPLSEWREKEILMLREEIEDKKAARRWLIITILFLIFLFILRL